jgi:integrase
MQTKLVRNDRNYWEIRWAEKGPDGAWTTRRVSTRTAHKQEAEAFRRAWLREELNDIRTQDHAPDIGVLVGAYQKHHVTANGVADAQVFSLKPVLAYVQAQGSVLEDLADPEWSLDYRAHRASLGRKDGTIRRELGALVAALNWCARMRKISKDQVPDLALPAAGRARELFMDETQESEFYARAMGVSIGLPRLARITRFVALALDTAARKAAILGLTWDRVDLGARMIDFRDPLVRATKKRRIVVPISDRLFHVLNRAKQEATSRYVLDTPGPIRWEWDQFVKTTGSPWMTPHVCRHTWATLGVRAGVPLWDVAGVLGDTVETVSKHYAHHAPDHLRGAINRRWA